ncbi:MAG TPA: DUF6458 family protein [Gaiellaceae bacterium]
MVGIPFSLLTVAAGAILAFAVQATTSGVDLHRVGWILIIVGLVGLVLSLVIWESENRPPAPPRAPRRRVPPSEAPTRRF